MKRLTRLPSITPPVAGRDLERGLQRRQARQHGLAAVGDVLRRRCRRSAERDELVDGLLPRVEHGELMSGLDQPARHREAHFSEADESDFHGAVSFFVIASEAKQSIFRFVALWIASLRSQ